MNLDGDTLLVFDVATRSCYALIFFVTWLRSRRETYLRDWCLGDASIAAGGVLVFATGRYDANHDPATGFLLGSLIALGFVLKWIGVRRFDGRPVRPWLAAVATFSPGAAFVVVPLVTRPEYAVAAMFAGSTLGTALLAFELLSSRAQLRLPSRYFASVSALAYLASLVVSTVLSLQGNSTQTAAHSSGVVVLSVDLICGLFLSISLLAMAGERARVQLERLATLDPLTGLLNRRGLTEAAARHVPLHTRGGAPVSVLLADLDGFKRINDRYGHDAGDAILVGFATLARRVVARRTDILARHGGEEFIAVLPATALAEAILLAERLRKATRDEPFSFGEHTLHVTVSIGVAAVEPGDTSIQPAISRADASLYAAKQAGRDRVVA